MIGALIWQKISVSCTVRNMFFTSVYCRLKKGKELRKEAGILDVEKNIHLVKLPAGMFDIFQHPICSYLILKLRDYFLMIIYISLLL